MRLAFGAKEGYKITAKMLGYYAEQAAIASNENIKIWDNFKTCMLDFAKLMDSKDSIRVLKGISKISEKLPSDHFIDLLNVTYNKIESHILNMSTSDLALIAKVAAKLGILDKSLSQALTISFLNRLAQSTPNEIVILVKSLKSLQIETEFYDEIVRHIYKTHSIFPLKDIISVLFLCIDSNMTDLLKAIANKIALNASNLSDELIIKALYIYSNNELEIPISFNINADSLANNSLANNSLPENLIPHFFFSLAVNEIDIRGLKIDLQGIQNQVIQSLQHLDSIGRLVLLNSISLNIINTAGSSRFYALYKTNYNRMYQIMVEIYNSANSANDLEILTHLSECIALFSNIYYENDLSKLFFRVIDKLDNAELESDEVVEWAKTIVPYVWLNQCEVGNNLDSLGETGGNFQSLPRKNLKTLHKIAINHVIFQREYPFNSVQIDRFNPPLVLPDINKSLQKVGLVSTKTFGKGEILLVDGVGIVPLYPIHYINGIGGLNPEIELPNSIIRQNVRNCLIDLAKQCKVIAIPYWKWQSFNTGDERVKYLERAVKCDSEFR